jgi:ribose 5-phosphate isomerase B
MRIAIGSDHAGYWLKEELARYLKEHEYEFKDFGVRSVERSDYPDTGLEVADAVARGAFDRGILVCGSGVGMSIAANKVPGIRAALCNDIYTASISRSHNDSNVLTLGERVVGPGVALEIVEAWLATEFSGEERHAKRIGKIAEIEKKYCKGG